MSGVQVVRYVADGWGVGEIWLEDGVVLASALPRPARSGSPGSDPGETEETVHPLARRLAAWFAGEPDPLDDVPLAHPEGTPFQDALAGALRTIPRGEVVTYGELAALAGRPRAPRAAGTFCATCDLCPFLPVHRVVGATGLGGFGSLGLDYKRRLLALEGVSL
jgi:methylated-DNA-[protein]-cysteine S-methyltransferase